MAERLELPYAAEASPGVWVVAVPIPDNPLRYVLVYAVASGDGGVVLIDAGWGAAVSFAALREGLAAGGIALEAIRGVVVTHLHPDHYGLAGRLHEETGCWVAMHPVDAGLIDGRYRQREEMRRRTRAWLVAAGAPAAEVEDTAESMSVLATMSVVDPDVLLGHGDDVPLTGRTLRAVHTPGHTPGHLCLYDPDAGILFSGDHLLPRITPNIGFHAQSDPDPLGDYLRSLRATLAYGEPLVLPGHEYRFRGLADRVAALAAHHEQRLDHVESLVREGARTVWEVCHSVEWAVRSGPRYLQRSALAETYAHLIHLETRHRLRRTGTDPQIWTVLT
jgi:glyoxylase-like metal-dependent hydrolase (beta-lactamase superfamily II)